MEGGKLPGCQYRLRGRKLKASHQSRKGQTQGCSLALRVPTVAERKTAANRPFTPALRPAYSPPSAVASARRFSFNPLSTVVRAKWLPGQRVKTGLICRWVLTASTFSLQRSNR